LYVLSSFLDLKLELKTYNFFSPIDLLVVLDIGSIGSINSGGRPDDYGGQGERSYYQAFKMGP
jgi:hypothetical protein